MVQLDWNPFDIQFLTYLAIPAQQLEALIKQNKGGRVGQTTVVSQKVHTFSPESPQFINVLQYTDAGQAFYQRKAPGDVYHLDIFHQYGQVDHHRIAATLKKAVEVYNLHLSINNLLVSESCSTNGVKADHIDVQTGTGGGRITGSLKCGKKQTLRRAHENHVHIAILMPMQHISFIFYAVIWVERAINEQGIELRCNEKITHVREGNNENFDLTEYEDLLDSFIQQRNPAELSEAYKKYSFAQNAIELLEDFNTLHEVHDFLQELRTAPSMQQLKNNLIKKRYREDIIDKLTGMGILESDTNQVRLTKYGNEFKQNICSNKLEIERQFRNTLRSMKPYTKKSGKNSIFSMVGNSVKKEPGKTTIVKSDQKTSDFSVTETIMAAASRMILEKNQVLRIMEQDFKYYAHERKGNFNICLLIDTSASMGGQRVTAAKQLIRHLLLTTPGQISVITFQGKSAELKVAFTRKYEEIEKSLEKIHAEGATPLARGLTCCIEYLQQTGSHNCLIMLLTDGNPTLADATHNPMYDALLAAKEIKKLGYGFVCFGLKPQRNFLTYLTQCAGGTVCLVDELETNLLINAVWNQ